MDGKRTGGPHVSGLGPLGERRAALGIPMSAVASRIGVSIQRICDWEAWARIPGREGGRSLWNAKASTAMAYAHALDCKLDGLMAGVPMDPRLGDSERELLRGAAEGRAFPDGDGGSLAEFMERSGVDTSALANLSGLSRQNISRWLRWRAGGAVSSAVDPSCMRVVSLCRLAAALGVSMDSLAAGLASAR